MFIYTDERYISEYEELAVLSKDFKGRRTHEALLEALTHVELFLIDGDTHSTRPFGPNFRCRLYCSGEIGV